MTEQNLTEWLKKMNYPGVPPTDETLQNLFRGSLAPVIQLLIDKAKPRCEIERTRKNIIIYQVENKDQLMAKSPNEALQVYEKRNDLDKEIKHLQNMNKEKEDNIKLVKNKMRIRNVKVKKTKSKIEELQIENVILQTKETELNNKLENVKSIKTETQQVLQCITNKNELSTNLNKGIEVIKEHTEKNDYCVTEDVYSSCGNLNDTCVSFLFSTAKKFKYSNSSRKNNASSIKKNNPTTTRRNIFETYGTTSISKQRYDKYSSKYSSCSSLNSLKINSVVNTTDNNYSLQFLNASFQDVEVKNIIDNIWDSDRVLLFETIRSMKEQHLNTLKNLVTDIGSFDGEISEQNDLSDFYNIHVQNELLQMKSIIERERTMKIINEKFIDLPDYIEADALEYGKEKSLNCLKESIKEFELKMVEDNLSSIISDIDDKLEEMKTAQENIDKHTCLLYDCKSWIDRSLNSVQNSVLTSFPAINEFILEENVFPTVTDKFVSLNYNYNNRDYMKGWREVYSNPELLEIIKSPYLCHDKIITNILSEKYKLKKLSTMSTNSIKTNFSITDSPILNMNVEKFEENIITDKLQQTIHSIRRNLVSCENLENIYKFHLGYPFNEMISENRLFDGKKLQDYVNEYEYWFKQV